MPDFLKKIYDLTAERIALAQKTVSAQQLQNSPMFARKPHNVKAAFANNDCNIIAEIKFASPSEGIIHQNGNHVPIAKSYLKAGASMLSILTEPLYFKGNLDYLKAVREACPDALLLRKDFIIDPYQLLEAKAYGADAVLLIVAMTAPALTRQLYEKALTLGLTPLLEVHDEADLDQALALGADFIGVNNRNLKTLKIDLETSRRLAARKPKGAVFICESGLSKPEDVRAMRELGFDGFLMGSHFMRQADPGKALQELKDNLKCA
jgi:indole-3-glycerol phosphate synthase